MNNRNLVITRAGRKSLHRNWLEPSAARNFDLLVTDYAQQNLDSSEPGVQVVDMPGKKVEGWSRIVKTFVDKIRSYERVAFIDDDILCSAEAISGCFVIGRQHGLSIWQPSLSWDSFFTYGGTLHNPSFILRYVNYIEMMCPFFTTSALDKVKDTFSLGFESGIDLIWCSLLPPQERNCAIVDEVQIKHTRPIGVEKSANGFSDRIYEDDIYECLALFEMKWPSLIADRAILKNGRETGQRGIALRTPAILGSLRKTPTASALKPVLDHLRHQALRRQTYSASASTILARLRTAQNN